MALIAGCLILAQSIHSLSQQLDRTAGQIAGVGVAVADAKAALGKLQPSPAAQRGPDPNRRYTIDTDGSPTLGPETAAVTLVEFSDFQCPFCARVGSTLQQVKDEYGDQVRLVFKHLPLDIHPMSPGAHAAAEAAHHQAKFWEMHDKIFANQRDLSPEKLVAYATELKLDVPQFQRDLASTEVKSRIDADKQQAVKLGATGTPAFFINGRYLSGAQPLEAFKRIIDAELARPKKKSA